MDLFQNYLDQLPVAEALQDNLENQRSVVEDLKYKN